MFEIKICNIFEAKALSEEWATHTISLFDPGIENYSIDMNIALPVVSPNRQRYFFYDHDIVNKYEHLQAILSFTAELNCSAKLLVHCQAGLSRSPAVACGILCQHGLTPYEAVKQVLSMRVEAFPNQHILRLFEEILGLDGLVATSHEQVLKQQQKM